MQSSGMKIGILTAGGDCPGLNAAIRGVGKTAMLEYGMRVYGFSYGFSGLIENDFQELTENQLSGILTHGGTILGTSREKPFKKEEKGNGNGVFTKPDRIRENYHNLGLDCLVCIGGNGTMKTANLLSQEGLNIIGIPKTIDNDVWGTDMTFGFDSALQIATDSIDRLHTTANSHRRIMVIEIMGHNTGWLALSAGLAAGGDIILLPEIPYSDEKVIDCIKSRYAHKKPYSIVVVAEGILHDPKKSAATHIGDMIKGATGYETRETILGYIQRGGTPSPYDRILATRFGAFAVELISQQSFGSMVAIQGNNLTTIPLAEAGTQTKKIKPDDQIIRHSRYIGTSFGD
jgi:ATP-dependent phosphofructokinase / diphosphate-dependent phosphofructokinase